MLIKQNFRDNIETIFIEINFQKYKGLLCGMYHPPSQSDQYFTDNLDKSRDVYSTYVYSTIFCSITGDFNTQEGEKCLDIFLC